ncbi:MAG: hypothetical protein ACPHRO_00650 [Nannocystaceae bacterium]
MNRAVPAVVTLLFAGGVGVYLSQQHSNTSATKNAAGSVTAKPAAGAADATPPPSEAAEPASEPQGPLAEALTPYLNIGHTLSSDSVEGLGVEIDKLDAALAKFENRPELAGARAQLVGLRAPDLEAARAAFLTVSRAMIIAATRDSASQAGMIKVHCPMAFASKGGRWIQREGKIRNPFEGSRMLACGAAEPWTPPAAP